MSYGDKQNYRPVRTKSFYVPIIPRVVTLGFASAVTEAQSTSFGVVLIVWKASVTISFQTYL